MGQVVSEVPSVPVVLTQIHVAVTEVCFLTEETLVSWLDVSGSLVSVTSSLDGLKPHIV